MFKPFLTTCALLLLAAASSAGGELVNPFEMAPSTPMPANAPKVAWAGETLKYSVSWGVINVGDADMKVEDIVDINGVPSYHVTSTAESNKMLDAFFKVRNVNESWISTHDLHSQGFTKKIREGAYVWDEWVAFDFAKKKYRGQTRNKKGENALIEGDIPGPVYDVFSAAYFVRTQELTPGKEIVLDVNTKKNWPLVVKVHKIEKVKVPAGTFECYLVEPFLRDKGLFSQKGKSLRVWLTTDKRRLPVKMEAEAFIGNVAAVLTSYSK